MKSCAGVAAVLLVIFLIWRSWPATRPATLGSKGGRLSDCPSSPNCVCSQGADTDHGIEPLPLTGEPATAWQRLQRIVSALPRARIVKVDDHYMHVEFTSLLCQYVDDVEFLADPAAGKIHVRSASRIGHSDLGVNRARVEQIRSRWSAGE